MATTDYLEFGQVCKIALWQQLSYLYIFKRGYISHSFGNSCQFYIFANADIFLIVVETAANSTHLPTCTDKLLIVMATAVTSTYLQTQIYCPFYWQKLVIKIFCKSVNLANNFIYGNNWQFKIWAKMEDCPFVLETAKWLTSESTYLIFKRISTTIYFWDLLIIACHQQKRMDP